MPPPPDAIEIVLATGNPHKVTEMREIFTSRAPAGVVFRGLNELGSPGLVEPTEHAMTFEENATIKALSYARQTGRLCLADDSGLEIDALGGRPGVISSHYCTDGREAGMSRAERDAANNARVLRELEGVPAAQRSARFVCVMALAVPQSWSQGRPAPGFEGEQRRTGTRLPHIEHAGATIHVSFRIIHGELSPPDRQLVLNALLHFHARRYMLLLACVMPDHVHAMLRTLPDERGRWPTLAGLMHSIKSFSSHEINKRRGTSGAVWQEGYHNRLLRSGSDYDDVYGYIERNPVVAGLVAKPWEYAFLVDPRRERQTPGAPGLQVGVMPGRTMGGTPMAPGFEGDGEAGQTPGETPGAPGCEGGTPEDSTERAKILALVRGSFEGRIGLPGEVPRGVHGFGYDPLFLVPPDYARTSAQLDPPEKNRLSHRAAAARAMAEEIDRLMRSGELSVTRA